MNIKYNTFSANMLKTFDDCPIKYDFLYNKKIYLPQKNNNAKIGENVHTLINYYLKKMDTSKFEQNLSKEEEILWKNFKNNEILQYDLLKSEYTFNVKLCEYWLTGRVDAMFNDSENYYIVDWKTGNEKHSLTDYQTCVYFYSIYEILKTKKLVTNEAQLHFKYIYLKHNSNTTFSYNSTTKNDQQQTLNSLINSLITYDFKNKQLLKLHSKCYTCNYFSICYNEENEVEY